MTGAGRVAGAFSLMLMLIFPLLAMPVAAHDPSTYTVIVREGNHTPNQVSIIVSDTVQYYNVDDRENITHHIGLDLNDDGDFDDEDEFSSGLLSGVCDWDNDSSCRRSWSVTFNSSEMAGDYALTDYVSDGTEIHILLDVSIDAHTPDVSDCIGAECDEEPQGDLTGEFESTQLLLVGGIVILILAILLGVWIVDEKSQRYSPPLGEDEES